MKKFVLYLSIVGMLFGWTSLRADDVDTYVTLLAKHDIAATPQSLAAYFQSLHPDEGQRRRIAGLIAQLGDVSFARREEAMNQLLRLPVMPQSMLQAAIAGEDPEIRWRAERVLSDANQRSADILYSAFQVIAQQKISGLAQAVVKAVPLCSESYLVAAAREALRGTATGDDLPLLHGLLKDENPQLRMAAVEALALVRQSESADKIRPLLADDDGQVRVTAARALLNQDDRGSLLALVKLLDHDDVRVRIQAVKSLREASGKNFGFTTYEKPEARAAARDKWQQWSAGDGQTAKLLLPLTNANFELGLTLICNYNDHKIYELDRNGKVVWEGSGGRHPWGCHGLPNGHRLVASYSDRAVIEYDTSGKEVWKKSGLPGGPTGVRRLENGNTLIPCTDSQRVVEVDRKGTEVWNINLPGRPTGAIRLDNGRTLVSLQNGRRVVEVDRAGKVQWEIKNLTNPFSVQRLANGNTLVACTGSGGVLEFDRSGKEVWSYKGTSNTYYAQRLESGNTLISGISGVQEIDRQGKVIWEKKMSSVSKAFRY